MMVRKLLLGLVLLGVLAPTASAANDPRIDMGLRAATNYWGQAAPCGAVNVSVDPAASLGLNANGYAQIETCTIWINPTLLAKPTNDAQATLVVCATVAHEIWHLIFPGTEHSSEPSAADPDLVSGATVSYALTVPSRQRKICPTPRFGGSRRADGKPRYSGRRDDRKWCRRNQPSCLQNYPSLARSILRLKALNDTIPAQLEMPTDGSGGSYQLPQ